MNENRMVMNQSSPLTRKMPIGIQSFEYLRRENYLYIDKTEFIYHLVTRGKPGSSPV